MRLAGTVHQPKPKDLRVPGRNVPTAITFAEPADGGTVTLDAVREALERLRVQPSTEEERAREALVGMVEGDGRNTALARVAGHLAVQHRDDREAYDAALTEANALCAEPVGAGELASIADSIWGREHAKPEAAVKTGKRSQATLLVELVQEQYELWRDASTEAPVAVRRGSAIGRPFRGNADVLRAELSAAFYDRYGKVPGGTALSDALKALEGLALRAPTASFAIRVAMSPDGAVYVDLAQAQERFVRVDGDGWRIVDESPVRFLRTNLTAPQVTPERGGSLDELRSFFPVSDETWPLLLGWLVATFLPDIPHPVAYLAGERGTGKSSTGEHSVALVDPVRVERRTAPSTEKDWAALVGAAWVTYMDNLSGIKTWFSDALCCAVTGGGTPYRRLYTDDDLHVIKIKRPVVISGIDLGAIRDDLADRTLTIPHDVIPSEQRRTEKELAAAWQEARARNLGVLLDEVSAVLRELPNVELATLPRMADFAQVLAALDQIHGTHSVQTYTDQADELDQRVLESEPVATAVMDLMAARPTPWKGTATELLERLNERSNVNTKDRWWPNDGTRLAQRLTRVTPLLRKVGIDVSRGKTNGHRILVIRNLKPESAA
jgi:Primase C terminal 1 (PriCT-1)